MHSQTHRVWLLSLQTLSLSPPELPTLTNVKSNVVSPENYTHPHSTTLFALWAKNVNMPIKTGAPCVHVCVCAARHTWNGENYGSLSADRVETKWKTNLEKAFRNMFRG